jgi:adenylate cyclase
MNVDAVRQFLIAQSDGGYSAAQFVGRLAEALLAAGLPLWRLSTTLLSFDPTIVGPHISWVRGSGTTSVPRSYAILNEPTFIDSPAKRVLETGQELRTRLDIPKDELPFAMLAELRAQGATDFFITPIRIGDALSSAAFLDLQHSQRTWLSLTSDAPAGFSDDDLAALRSLLSELALRFALETSKESTRSLLRAYLGPNAARRVLDGAFRRGTAALVRSVIWFCDMRGFTNLSDTSTPEQVVRALDRYFDCVAQPIEARGGEVLKFIGDAVLAIFPYDEDHVQAACERAMGAAREAVENLRALRATPGAPPLSCGVALHLGDVYYGNIGTPSRLDFTVIGSAVNEVCRIEALTRPLAVDVLMTAAFVLAARATGVRSLGRHSLKGVAEEAEVFTFA